MKKRALSLFLAVCIVLGLCPTATATSGTTLPFQDVSESNWFYEAVAYAYQNHLMNGTSGNMFSPNEIATRGMIVSILYRLEGTPNASSPPFSDVPTGRWYAGAVTWASAAHIVDGYGDGTFGPNNAITREQLATILYRYSQYKNRNTASESGTLRDFSDAAQISPYAVIPMQWAVGSDFILGMEDNALAPKEYSTRAQSAAIIMRYCEAVADQNDDKPDKTANDFYTVTFDLGYGLDRKYDTQTVKGGEVTAKPANPRRNGYSFDGWYTLENGGSRFDFNIKITSDISLYAHWSKLGGGSTSSAGKHPDNTSAVQYYTVSFHANGNEAEHMPQAQRVRVKACAAKPEAPVCEGYLFGGWYRDSKCLNEYNFGSPVTSDITLYAQWIKINDGNKPTPRYYTVSFNANRDGVEHLPQVQQVEAGKHAVKPEDPVCEGYSFGGWYRDSACLNEYNFGSPVTTAIMLYAQWTKIDDGNKPAPQCYVVSFNANRDGVEHLPQVQQVEAGKHAVKPEDPVCEGYLFGGWYYDSECLNEYDFSTSINADVLLYAKWIVNGSTDTKHRVTFMLNDSSSDLFAVQMVETNGYAIKPDDPVRSQYLFTGWFTARSGGDRYEFDTRITSDLTLFAHWTKTGGDDTPASQYYTVSFHANRSGVEHLPQVQRVRAGASAVRPETPVCEGFVFGGWYRDSQCLHEYTFSSPVTADITLYAKWTNHSSSKAQHSVTFLYNDGSLNTYTMQIVETNGYATRPADPEWGTGLFNGWYTDPEGTAKYNFSSQITHDLTLYAGWTKTDDQVSISSGGETIYSITDIQMRSNQVEVTINVNAACTLTVEFLDEENHTLLTRVSSQTPDYCELAPVSLPVTDKLLDHYLIRAVLVDENGKNLCAPFITMEYTSSFAAFDALTVDDFDGKTVLNFDSDATNNFGVLRDDIKIITPTDGRNVFEVEEMEVEGEIPPKFMYTFTNIDSDVSALKSGDKIYVEDTQHMFTIGSIHQNQDGSITMTADEESELADFYEILKVDLSIPVDDAQTSNESGIMPTADSDDDRVVGIDATGALSGKISGGTQKYAFSGTFTGSTIVNIKINFDGDHLIDWFVCFTTGYVLNVSGHIKKNNLDLDADKLKKDEIELKLPRVKVPTGVPVIYVYLAPTIPVEWSAAAGASLTYTATHTYGFIYNSMSDWHPIDKREQSARLNLIEGEVEIRPTVKVAFGVSVLRKFRAEVVPQAGVRLTAGTSVGHDWTDDVEEKHACGLCLDGNMNWYAAIRIRIPNRKPNLNNKFVEVELVKFEAPIKFGEDSIPGKCYFSLINDRESIFGGMPKFGFGSACPNKTWRTVVQAMDKDGNLFPVEIHKADGTLIGSSTSPYILYLYNGTYRASAVLDSIKEFMVDNLAQEVTVQIDLNETKTCVISYHANNGSGKTAASSIDSEEQLILPDCMFDTPAGKKFRAWKIGETEYQVGDTYRVQENIDIYAIWEDDVQEPEVYTITFLANGGSGTMNPISLSANSEYVLPSCSFMPPVGCAFECWEIDGQRYNVGYRFTIVGDIVASVVWGEPRESYTITYDENYGGGNVQTVTKYAGDTIGSTPTPTRDGYVFISWNTAIDGAGTEASYYTPVSSDITYYAQWGRKAGDFVVVGENGYSYSDGVLHITGADRLTIRNAQVGVLTTDHIVIDNGVSANLTLAGVYIDARDADTAAVLINPDSQGDVTITLASGKTNTLYGGKKHPALEKSGTGDEVGTLIINGPGSLNAYGGLYSPGIGSTASGLRNLIINGGTIYSRGGTYGSGIGCATDFYGGRVIRDLTINGGNISAYGHGGGAGIGGGFTQVNPGTTLININIFGGTVYAAAGWVNTNRGDYIGAAIGSGAFVHALGEWAMQGGEYSNTENWRGTVTRVRGNSSTTTVY